VQERNVETGIIGLPLAGKTTIFNALTSQQAHLSSAAGGKKQTNLADVQVPDIRVEKLAAIFNPKKKVQATVLFKDVQTEITTSGGLSPATLGEIRSSDALSVIVRSFEDDAVYHPFDKIDPAADLKLILDSLVFSDYEIIAKRLERLDKEAKRGSRDFQVLEKLSKRLEEGSLIGEDFMAPEEARLTAGFSFLTAKPVIVVANIGADTDEEKDPGLKTLRMEAARLGLDLFAIRGDQEMEIAQLSEEDQQEFLADLGLSEPARNRFIQHIYTSLDLISFLTVGDDEVRAWSIPRGTAAVKAAGKIHSDLEKGFIRAEVIHNEELLALGGLGPARKQGKLRLEGKNYIVQDGDVLTIRFNV
jgi:GTP-binding protein YchF